MSVEHRHRNSPPLTFAMGSSPISHETASRQASLLGGWSEPSKDGDFNRWKPDQAMVAATINLAATTGRLDQQTMPDRGERGEALADEDEELVGEEEA